MLTEIDIIGRYLDRYMEEVKPRQTREVVTQGLMWHVLTENGYGSRPFGIIGYTMVTGDGKEYFPCVSLIYIQPSHRGKPKLWVKKILEVFKKFKSTRIQLQVDAKIIKLTEKLFNKKPSVCIYDIDATEIGD